MDHEELVNRTGYPLQIALENLIGREQKQNGWRVIYSEHQWRNDKSNESGFIDLIVEISGGVVVLVIECKRVFDSSWIFLNSKGEINNRRHTKAWYSNFENSAFKHFDWREIAIDPPSPECEYSIVLGQDPKSKPMLERTAATLVSSTEAFAIEESAFFNKFMDTRIYFNVIVTTAKIQVGEFDPSIISFSDGTISNSSFQEVPFIRFRKQLQPQKEVSQENRFDYLSIARAKENSVFIVNSEHITEFLDSFDVGRL